MKLDDAELQQTTGFVIAKGAFRIGSEADMAALGIGAHDRVLLSSENGLYFRRTTVSPITHIRRDDNGFCETTPGEAELKFSSLSLDDIAELSLPEAGRGSLTRGGAQAGMLAQRRAGVPVAEPIRHYQLDTEYGLEGLQVAISGQVAVAKGEHDKPFSVEATIFRGRPWSSKARVIQALTGNSGTPTACRPSRILPIGRAIPGN
jgi:hypothetical protein